MIQSGKFDSSDMDIKKLSNTALTFITNRLIEIFGISVLIMGVLIFIALASYSPEDPNFIFPENTIIKNQASIGPFARLRDKTKIEKCNSEILKFVKDKQIEIVER